MTEVRRILCPVDLSLHSRYALEHAVVLARWYRSKVVVFHAHDAHEDRGAALQQIASLVEPLRPSGVELDAVAIAGPPVQSILEVARSLPADVVVMGTHGRGGLDHLVLGSVAEKVLRKASCPVLTVPPRVSAPPREAPVLMNRILCPVDFSAWSMQALRYAQSIAAEADGELLVLHVIEGLHAERLTSYPDFNVAKYLDHLEIEAGTRLKKAIPSDANGGHRTKPLIVRGTRAYEDILGLARERDVHLIVIGVHGRSAMDLALFGSTTHHVIRAAICPVLTLRG
jgi:nucleotide-binding universal stress UspA family protein